MKRKLLYITGDYPPYDGGKIGHSIRSGSLTEFLAEHFERVFILLIGNKLVPSRPPPKRHSNIEILNERDTSRPPPVGEFSHFVDWTTSFMTEGGVNFLISSGPPLSAHLVAYNVSKTLRTIRWVADVRDLHCVHAGLRGTTPQDQQKLQYLEFQILCGSEHITTVSSKMASHIKIKCHEMFDKSKEVTVIENGFVEYDLRDSKPQSVVEEFVMGARIRGKKIIYYAGTGSISVSDEKIPRYKELWPFISTFAEFSELQRNFSIILQGAISINQKLLSSLPPELSILILPPAENSQIMHNLMLADVGLSLNLDEMASPFILGGKLYDYLASGVFPLLVYPVEPESIIANLTRLDIDFTFAPSNNTFELKKILIDEFEKFSRRSIRIEDRLHEFSRKRQYKKFLDILA